MRNTGNKNWQYFGAIVFWLLPLLAMPLAFGRLTGEKIPLFGMVQLTGFSELGFISLAVILLNISKFTALWKNSLIVRLAAIAGAMVILAALIQQFIFGGSLDNLWHAVFYAATPLAAAVIAPELRRTLPTAAKVAAVLLLLSGIASEKFTGITGNWNWTQILLFALLPGFFIRYQTIAGIKYILIAFAALLTAGWLFYPEQLSITLLTAVPLIIAGMWIWKYFSARCRNVLAVILFALLLTAICGIAKWENVTGIYNSRVQLFASTANLLEKHHIIGVGPGRFFDFIQEFITREYFLAPFAALHHPHPHNELLFLWSSFGIAGLLFIAIIFCGVLNSFPTSRRINSRNLFPIWIFMLIFVCAQTDLTGSIITGAFWMLASAGISMSPHRKFYGKSSNFKYIAFVLTAIAAISAFINLRATLPLRTGRLAAMRGDAQTALKYYNESIKIKMSKEALYGKAEIFLHAYGDINNALKSLEDMHNHLGFYNYLHTNRIKTVCLVNANSASAALEFIKLELQAYPLSIINHKLHLDLLKLLKCPQEEISAAEKGFFTACHLRKLSPEQGAKLTMAEDDKYSAN